MSEGPARHRIGLEIEIDPEQVLVDPDDWDLEDLGAALRDGMARPVRVIRGRVTDEQRDPLSTTLDGWAADLELMLRLHWTVAESPHALIRPPEGSPRPSLETLVELRALAEQMRRVAERLRAERL